MRRALLMLPLCLAPLMGCEAPAAPNGPLPPSAAELASAPQPSVFHIVTTRGITWLEARTAAASVRIKGQTYSGHLATPSTILDSSTLLAQMRLGQECWVGAFQPSGAATPGAGWTWLDGDVWNYAAWTDGAPEDGDGVENGAENVGAYHHLRTGSGMHDLSGTLRLTCYVVELDEAV